MLGYWVEISNDLAKWLSSVSPVTCLVLTSLILAFICEQTICSQLFQNWLSSSTRQVLSLVVQCYLSGWIGLLINWQTSLWPEQCNEVKQFAAEEVENVQDTGIAGPPAPAAVLHDRCQIYTALIAFQVLDDLHWTEIEVISRCGRVCTDDPQFHEISLTFMDWVVESLDRNSKVHCREGNTECWFTSEFIRSAFASAVIF